MNLETVICPKCGNPYPKRRYDLGYRCCVNCSTEKALVCRVEEHGEGDHTYNTIRIMKPEEAYQLYKAEHKTVDVNPEETVPDYSTFEEQEESAINNMNFSEREARLSEMEGEFLGISERSTEEIEQLAPLMDLEGGLEQFDTEG